MLPSAPSELGEGRIAPIVFHDDHDRATRQQRMRRNRDSDGTHYFISGLYAALFNLAPEANGRHHPRPISPRTLLLLLKSARPSARGSKSGIQISLRPMTCPLQIRPAFCVSEDRAAFLYASGQHQLALCAPTSHPSNIPQ